MLNVKTSGSHKSTGHGAIGSLCLFAIVLCPLYARLTAAEEQVAQPPFFAGNDELRAYLLEAAENHPSLKARHAEWQAAIEKVPQVTALDDPMFMYTQFVQSEDKLLAVAIEQKFPWFGTLRARGDKALAEADTMFARIYVARNALFARVKRAYFDYAWLYERVAFVHGQADILKDVEELVRSRYSLGVGSEAEIFRVQIEQEKVKDQLGEIEQMKPALAAALNETLGRETAEAPPEPQPAPFPPSPPPAPVIAAQLRLANPELKAMENIEESWRRQQKVAKKAGYPDFSVAVEYGNMKGMSSGGNLKDDVMLTVRFSLPIWRERVKAGIREAKQMESATEHDRRSAALTLEASARKALFEIEDAQRRMALYKDTLIPKARKTYESIQIAYAAGADADLLALLDSVRMVLDFQLEQTRAARDLQVACADLEMILGSPWTESRP
jgi:outer membrane protein, heavy metal efflux system